MQRILENCKGTPEVTSIMNEIMNNIEQLSSNQFGNYVIQHILEHGSSDEVNRIVQALKSSLVHLSKEKFSSNVVEKCIKAADASQKSELIDMILQYDPKTQYINIYII